MITVPMWMFTTLCALAGLSLLAAVGAWLRAQRTVDQILADELDRQWDDDAPTALGFNGTRPNTKHPVLVTITEQVPRRPITDQGDGS